MTLLASHLEQISASAKTVAELEYVPKVCFFSACIDPWPRFPPSKIFTNALLNNPEITTLIRDTEPHERALFSLDPAAISRQQNKPASTGVEPNLHGRMKGSNVTHPIKQSAVSRVLGTEMLREIKQSSNARSQGGVDVEILLRGAERLCQVYSVPGASDRIRALRNRHREVSASITGLEEKISQQQSVLDRKNSAFKSDNAENEDDREPAIVSDMKQVAFTEEDLQHEEDEIRELEARKKALEDLVSDLERDLGGLLK
jgi:hypothetical protein